MQALITQESLDELSRLDAFGSQADGAVLVFQGRVREMNRGRAVSGITYEAYGEMARRELDAICREAADSFDACSVYAAHRTGDLGLGEVSVVIAVAAPHRDDCYRASRWIIEAVKVRLPVWKHERYADGGSRWVGAPTRAGGSGERVEPTAPDARAVPAGARTQAVDPRERAGRAGPDARPVPAEGPTRVGGLGERAGRAASGAP